MSAPKKPKGKRIRERSRITSKKKYEVGYKKPPRDGQFQKGHTGNSKGRPRGSRNFNSIMRQLMEKPMTLVIDGEKIKVTGREAIAYRVFQKAVAGDAKCIDILRSIERESDLELSKKEQADKEAKGISNTDEEILNAFLKSASRSKKGGKK